LELAEDLRSVQNSVLAYGFANPQISPFVDDNSNAEHSTGIAAQQNDHDFLLNPLVSIPNQPDPILRQNDN